MCKANNFISSVQTSGIRIRITGYSFRKALETEKNLCWNHFYIGGKRQHMFFFVFIKRFRQFGAEKNFINSFSNFLKSCSESTETWKKTQQKNHFFSLPRGSVSAKKCESETLQWRLLLLKDIITQPPVFLLHCKHLYCQKKFSSFYLHYSNVAFTHLWL